MHIGRQKNVNLAHFQLMKFDIISSNALILISIASIKAQNYDENSC